MKVSLGRRFLSSLVDLVLCVPIFIAVPSLMTWHEQVVYGKENAEAMRMARNSDFQEPPPSLQAKVDSLRPLASRNQNLEMALCAILLWAYHAGFESSRKMATPGKMLTRTVVTDRAGQRIGFVRASLRFLFKLVQGGFWGLLLGMLMAALAYLFPGLPESVVPYVLFALACLALRLSLLRFSGNTGPAHDALSFTVVQKKESLP